jgi:hypothetical protein
VVESDVGDHVPAAAVRTDPTVAVPVIDGETEFVNVPAIATRAALVLTNVAYPARVAVTSTVMLAPKSAPTIVYVDDVASVMLVPFLFHL